MSTSPLQVPLPDAEPGPSRRRPSYIDLSRAEPEIIIIGAGIAGSALAYGLSHAGRNVLLLERDLSEPDRIVGELLQPGGVAALSALGLGKCLEGIDAVPVEGYCVVNGNEGRQVAVPYPMMEQMAGEREAGGEVVDAGGLEGKAKENGHAAANGHLNGHLKEHSNGHGQNGHQHATSGLLDSLTPPFPSSSQWHVPSLSGKKEGRSFHHGRLISSLRRACLTDAPNLTVLEATVRDLVYCEHTNKVIGVNAAFKIPLSSSEAAVQSGMSYAAAADSSIPTSTGEKEADSQPTTKTVVRSIYAPLTIIADGCFSKFRSLPGSRLPKAQTRSHFVGAIIPDIDLPIPHMGTVCLTPSGPVLLYQIADKARETRMLVDVKGKLPSVADGSLKDHLLSDYIPHLPPSLRSPVSDALSSQRLRTMPNSFLPPSLQGSLSPTSLSGAILVGDAYNMRHPLTGGGMTVAFNDAVLLTSGLRPGGAWGLPAGKEGLEDWTQISEGLRDWFWARKKLAGVVNVLSMALYDLFGGAETDLAVLREGCFRYFELGGECVAGPVGLLSALTPKPLMLFYHFFSVAFYSIWILLVYGKPPGQGEQRRQGKASWAEVPGLVLFSGQVFWTACVVLLPVIWTEFRI